MKYCLINVVMWLNKRTIWDIMLLPIVDEFAKRFTSILMVTLIDLYLGYD